MELSHPELMLLAQEVNVFSRSLTYLTENYFIGALTVRRISKEGLQKFGSFLLRRPMRHLKLKNQLLELLAMKKGIAYLSSRTPEIFRNANCSFRK